MRKFLTALLVAAIGFTSPALAQSTVNPLVPAQNAPLASAPVRSNFAAAYSDINGLLGMHAVSSLGACSVQTQTIGADCLVEQSASNYLWYKYTGIQGYVLVGTINPSINPPTFSAGLPPISNGHLIANCSGATGIPGDCAWTTYADQAIGATNGDLPLRISGTWGVAVVGTSGHAIPFLDGSGLVFSNQITSGVAGSTVGGYCLANATSGNVCLAPQSGALGSSVATFPANSGIVAELNALQTFTSRQTINLNTATLPSPLNQTVFNVGQIDGTTTRVQITSFGAVPTVSSVTYGGTNSSPIAVTSGTRIGRFDAWAYNGASLSSNALAAVDVYAAENVAVGHQGSSICLATTALASVSLADGVCQQPSGGFTVGAPTGADEGIGTANLAGNLYLNGTQAATSINGTNCLLGGTCTITAVATSVTYGTTLVNGGVGILFNTTSGGSLTALNPVNSTVVSFNGSGVLQASAALPSGLSATNMALTTPAIGVATGTSLALGGATLGTNAFAVTGTTALGGELTLNTALLNSPNGPLEIVNGGSAQSLEASSLCSDASFSNCSTVPANGLQVLGAAKLNGGLTVSSSFTATGLVTFADMASAAVATSAQYIAGTASTLVPSNVAYTAETTTTYGTTTTFDFSTFINTAVTLTGNITTMTLANVKAGQAGQIRFIQDGTGSRTTVWNSTFKFANGVTPTLSTVAGTIDVLFYSCISTSICYASLTQNMK